MLFSPAPLRFVFSLPLPAGPLSGLEYCGRIPYNKGKQEDRKVRESGGPKVERFLHAPVSRLRLPRVQNEKPVAQKLFSLIGTCEAGTDPG